MAICSGVSFWCRMSNICRYIIEFWHACAMLLDGFGCAFAVTDPVVGPVVSHLGHCVALHFLFSVMLHTPYANVGQECTVSTK